MSKLANQKTSSRVRRASLCAAAISSVFWLAGCAAPSATSAAAEPAVEAKAVKPVLSPEEWVKQRSQLRWNLLRDGKFADAYQFLAPGVRAVLPVETYVKSFGPAGMWTQADVANVVCDQPERCTSNVTVGLKVASLGFTRTPTVGNVPEVWVFEENNWWIFVQQ